MMRDYCDTESIGKFCVVNRHTDSSVQAGASNPAWGNQSSDRLGYDGSGRPITKRYLASGLNSSSGYANTSAFAGFTTSYDASGNKLYERQLHCESRDHLYQPYSNGVPQNGYDSLDRLLQYQRGILAATGAALICPSRSNEVGLQPVLHRLQSERRMPFSRPRWALAELENKPSIWTTSRFSCPCGAVGMALLGPAVAWMELTKAGGLGRFSLAAGTRPVLIPLGRHGMNGDVAFEVFVFVWSHPETLRGEGVRSILLPGHRKIDQTPTVFG